ncbi:FusB/FusC family EF-G-binding protein [Brevibacillus reuszeri]|uniref:FusB/FusC family EF-G-binding protein n=1 Tax=Brevibacillus reuszeri TaxID=54915 RepID=UPI000CCC4678|nr:FusB/FusC family EF-G-binding protein [Brevibacillus reuszeri]
MEPFIKSHEYNFIKAQVQAVINGHANSSDRSVLNALKDMAKEKVFQLFPDLTEEQKQLLEPIHHIEDRTQSKKLLAELSPYVIPFRVVTEQALKKLFPKVKKLKAPKADEINWKELSYLGWFDEGSSRKYIVTHLDNKLVGVHGTFTSINQKGVCAICNDFADLGMFVADIKASGDGAYLKKGNYICEDSQQCNRNITDLDKLHDFVRTMQIQK